MYTVNCDIGERGARHPIDDQLMQNINIANIACGGHAGDVQSIEYYVSMARKYNVEISAHIGYRDPENFGRVTMNIGLPKLVRDMDFQWGMIQSFSHIRRIEIVKFHGALYNDSVNNESVARSLACWLDSKGISKVITLENGYLAKECESFNIKVIPEFFAERTYRKYNGILGLTPRTWKIASIINVVDAFDQVMDYFFDHKLIVFTDITEEVLQEDTIDVVPHPNTSVCVHSDSPIALELCKKISNEIKQLTTV